MVDFEQGKTAMDLSFLRSPTSDAVQVLARSGKMVLPWPPLTVCTDSMDHCRLYGVRSLMKIGQMPTSYRIQRARRYIVGIHTAWLREGATS